MEIADLQQLMVEELKDLYNAEKQILKALPKVAKKATSPELRQAIEHHYEETENQVDRLEQVLGKLGESPRGKKCKGMQGMIEENEEMMAEKAEPDVMDAGLIVGLQKVEHYEIAGYGSCVSFAKLLGNTEAAELLSKTLDEEEQADKKLSQIAKRTVNMQAQ